jgi:hypothetical protein
MLAMSLESYDDGGKAVVCLYLSVKGLVSPDKISGHHV